MSQLNRVFFAVTEENVMTHFNIIKANMAVYSGGVDTLNWIRWKPSGGVPRIRRTNVMNVEHCLFYGHFHAPSIRTADASLKNIFNHVIMESQYEANEHYLIETIENYVITSINTQVKVAISPQERYSVGTL